MFMSIFIAADGEARRELVWAADALTSSCPACAAVAVYVDGRTLLLHGTFPAALLGNSWLHTVLHPGLRSGIVLPDLVRIRAI